MDGERFVPDPVDDLDLDLDLGSDWPPAPPVESGPERGPSSPHDGWMSRSPYWALPLLVSLLFGIERLLMLAVVPGYRDLTITVFGALFVATFAAVLAIGGLIIGRFRY